MNAVTGGNAAVPLRMIAATVPLRVDTLSIIPVQLPLMTNEQCLCEFADHFSPPDELGDTHPYAHRCEGVIEVQTIYGIYPICLKCRTDHPVPTDMLGRDIEVFENE